MVDLKETSEYVSFLIRVIPRSSKTMIVGEHDGALKVKISSPPVDGAANEEVIKLLAKTLGVARSQVSITSGQTSKSKHIRISGVNADSVRKALGI